MRYLIVFVSLGLLCQSCNHNEDPELVNKWHLIAQLADPGDGSGTFQPVESDKTVEFFADGTVSSNGSMCTMTSEVGSGSSGTYNDSTMTIYVDNCNLGTSPIAYELDGSFLILDYPCIEPCREKYEQVE